MELLVPNNAYLETRTTQTADWIKTSLSSSTTYLISPLQGGNM